MDAQQLLEQLLNSGKQLASKGRELALKGKDLADQGLDLAADTLGVSEDSEARDQMKGNIAKGAAATGVLALILGTKTGRKLALPALKIGSVAALGALGYKAYEKYREQKGIEEGGFSIENLDGTAAEERSLLVIRSMINAAKADGKIDAEEEKLIVEQIKQAGLESQMASLLLGEVQKPLDIEALAAEAKTPQSAVEAYLGSLIVADGSNPKERDFLDKFAAALKLDTDLAKHLELEAAAG